MNGFALRGVGAKVCVAVGLALVGIVAIADRPSIAAPEKERERVSAFDLGSKIDVIGKLGVPLGKLVTIEGRVAPGDVIQMKAVMSETVMFVERIDEKPARSGTWIVLRPFGPGDLNVRKKTRCKLLGYENGGFSGSPDGAMEASGTTFADYRWCFDTEFECAKVIEAKPDESKEPYPVPPMK